MDKERAIELLERQIKRIGDIPKSSEPSSPEFRTWHRGTEVVIERIFGVKSRHSNEFKQLGYSGAVIIGRGRRYDRDPEIFLKGLEMARQLLQSMIEEINDFDLSTDAVSPSVDLVLRNIFERFHLVARQLRDRHDERDTLEVNDEHDAQDLLHAILHLFADDIRREEWTPSYAGGSSRMDFLLKNEGVVVELKRVRKGLGARQIGEELLIDIGRYQAHPGCRTLVCFVYDPEGMIGNPIGLENDLTKKPGDLSVTVIVGPKGR